ncbi:MAG: flagellar basal body P-ring formation protein FlgA [Deltaproteobacteria bacterium]|nr:flagellar basal body P-ring formation protein FlgA [Deltaproteobacteria bacterium]
MSSRTPLRAGLAIVTLFTVTVAAASIPVSHARSRQKPSQGELQKKSSERERALSQAIVELVRERLSLPDAEIEVTRLEVPEAAVFAGASQLGSIELASRGRPTGWITVRQPLTFGGEARDLWVKALVTVRAPSVVATRALERGQTLIASDLAIALAPLDETRITDPAALVGAIVRTPIERGDVVPLRAVQRPMIVQRGDTVLAIVGGDAFELRAPAEALTQGALGDEIEVRTKVGKKTIRGTITAPGEVEVR